MIEKDKRSDIMKKFKVIFVVFVFCVLALGKAFTQDNKKEYIKPTFGAGVGVFNTNMNDYTEILTVLALDVDLINSFGLTFGFQSAMAWNNYIAPISLLNGGIGYTYTANKWSAGGKIMFTASEGGGLGLNVNGTYWFLRNLGVTGTVENYFFYFGPPGYNLFYARLGISTKI